jgi:hypothetical protein
VGARGRPRGPPLRLYTRREVKRISFSRRMRARVLQTESCKQSLANKRYECFCLRRMIPKSGVRFSDKIMRHEKGRRSADRRIQPCPRHTRRRYRLKVLRRGSDPSGDRSPLGAPTAALATQINAMAQPRPRFTRNTMRRRYLRSESRLQRCTSRAGRSAGRSMPRPPGSGVTNPTRGNRTRSIDGCRRRRPFDERSGAPFTRPVIRVKLCHRVGD